MNELDPSLENLDTYHNELPLHLKGHLKTGKNTIQSSQSSKHIGSSGNFEAVKEEIGRKLSLIIEEDPIVASMSKQNNVRNLIRMEKLIVLGLQETKMASINLNTIWVLWGNSNFHYCVGAVVGASGVSLINIYGPQGFRNKEELWRDLLDIINSTIAVLILFEDFNAIHSRNEREGFKLSKLDWFLVLNNFFSLWKNAKVKTLAREISDHCPIMLSVDSVNFGPKCFKFFNNWIEDDDLNNIVKTSWETGLDEQDVDLLEAPFSMDEVKQAFCLADDGANISLLQYVDDALFFELLTVHGSLPFSYLGLPVGKDMNMIEAWSDIVNRFTKKLSSWKANLLSIGGWLTLVKSVLEDVSSSMKGNKNKMAWICWQKIISCKKDGGLGVGSIKAKNTGLMGKWKWHFLMRQLLFGERLSSRSMVQMTPLIHEVLQDRWSLVNGIWEPFWAWRRQPSGRSEGEVSLITSLLNGLV
nr:RNA-directed DNA polymerase, eukaryota, reverse transcriptase zinc-binding domain protein [Tanacetum cinerariifolium]